MELELGLGLGSYGIMIEEADGYPAGFCAKLKVTNGTLTNNGDGSFSLAIGGGASDHGALTGLLDDDHTQYGLLAGRAGGQTLIGGTGSGDGLTLNSTSNATKGTISIGAGSLSVSEVTGDVTIGANLTVGAIYLDGYMYRSTGDPNTALHFRDDRISFYAGARTMIDMHEANQDYLYLGYDGSQDIDIYIGPNGCLRIEGSSCDVTIYKSGTADVGTQYDSYDANLLASVWDETNTQAEDRNITLRNVGGSGVHGSEPYYLAVLDNDGNEIFTVDPVNTRVGITDKLYHIGDTNTYIEFGTDEIDIMAGGACSLKCNEVDGYGYITMATGSGAERQKTWRVTLADDATDSLDVLLTNGGFLFIIATDTGVLDEWALFILGGDGNVTLIANSANVVANADTDANLCIGTAADQEPLTIKNRLGGSRVIQIHMFYY